MRRLLLPLALIAILGTLLASVRPAHGCSCTVSLPQAQVSAADTIVIGTVARVFDNPYTIEDSGRLDDQLTVQDVDAEVEVERYLKGSGPTDIIVDDPQHGGGCGILEGRSLDSRYLLFLTGTTTPFETNLCSGSLPIAGPGLVTLAVTEEHAAGIVESVTAITGPGTLPTRGDPASSQATSDTPWLPIALGASLGTAGLGLSALWAVRRGRP